MKALYAARAAVGPLGTQPPTPDSLAAIFEDAAALNKQADFCYAYPETSANLQSYLKSRSRKPGLYLLLDVGAGTVDLTFFQLLEDESNDAPLRYFHASVLDAGSSLLELLTVKRDRRIPLLDAIAHKEGKLSSPSADLIAAFSAAQREVHNKVGKLVGDGVQVTESKLHRDRHRQLALMKDLRLIFSGGGFTKEPYGEATLFFQRARQWSRYAEEERLSEPTDLDWSAVKDEVSFRRMSVAYGLSFPRNSLENHRFPSQVLGNFHAVQREVNARPSAPTKDDV